MAKRQNRPASNQPDRRTSRKGGRDRGNIDSSQPRQQKPPQSAEGWNHVAQWYEGLVSQERSDYHEQLVVPGVMRLLASRKALRVLDIACGEGVMCRRLAELGAQCVGVDASEQLIQAARRQAEQFRNQTAVEFYVGDARALDKLPPLARQAGTFDAAICVLALMNIEPFEPVLQSAANLLKPGGTMTAVILHPAFRNAPHTTWGWDNAQSQAVQTKESTSKNSHTRQDSPSDKPFRQFRRVDAYLSCQHRDIIMNPGEAAHGKLPIVTTTWHRPIQNYINGFAQAGLLIDRLEEWVSHRVSEAGPRAAELDRSRGEIPLFLALRGRKT